MFVLHAKRVFIKEPPFKRKKRKYGSQSVNQEKHRMNLKEVLVIIDVKANHEKFKASLE